MAGTLTISTLNDSSGVLATQNGMTGIAKAWLSYDGSTQTIRGSFNISSVTRSGTGAFTINFTTAMSNVNYSITGASSTTGGSNPVIIRLPNSPSTTAMSIETIQANGTTQDPVNVCIAVFGS
jgi:hypothetical protein